MPQRSDGGAQWPAFFCAAQRTQGPICVQTEAASTESSRFDLFFAPAFFGIALLLAFVAAAKSPEPAMQIQAWTVMGGVIAILLWFVHRYAKGIPADDTTPYANDVVKAGV